MSNPVNPETSTITGAEVAERAKRLRAALQRMRPNDPMYKNITVPQIMDMALDNIETQLNRAFPGWLETKPAQIETKA